MRISRSLAGLRGNGHLSPSFFLHLEGGRLSLGEGGFMVTWHLNLSVISAESRIAGESGDLEIVPRNLPDDFRGWWQRGSIVRECNCEIGKSLLGIFGQFCWCWANAFITDWFIELRVYCLKGYFSNVYCFIKVYPLYKHIQKHSIFRFLNCNNFLIIVDSVIFIKLSWYLFFKFEKFCFAWKLKKKCCNIYKTRKLFTFFMTLVLWLLIVNK